MLDGGFAKNCTQNDQCRDRLAREISGLRDQLGARAKRQKPGLDGITRTFRLQRELATKVAELEHLAAPGGATLAWSQKAHCLYRDSQAHVAKLIFANRLLGRDEQVYYVDPDTCVDCANAYTFDAGRSLNICDYCGNTQKVLIIAEDVSQDILVCKHPMSKGSNELADSGKKPYVYLRSPLYRRFLRQFSVDFPVIPNAVMRLLYRYLSNIHLQTSVRCRPTPIANILRAKGYSKWANASLRISKKFNGDPIPLFSRELSENLVSRFEIVFQVATQHGLKSSIPCFEFTTHILLRMEKRPDLSLSFALHKTQKVLKKTMASFELVLDKVRRENSTFSWDHYLVL